MFVSNEDPDVLDNKKWADRKFGLTRVDTPQYLFEGCQSEDEYEQKMVKLADDLLEESQTRWRDIKRRWHAAYMRLELVEVLATKAGVDRSDLPITPQAIEESVALLVEGLPRPEPASRDAEQDQFVGTLAHFFDRELEANNFDLLMGKVIFNQKYSFMGITKLVFEAGKPGPFMEDGRLAIRPVDARYFWPDPLAKGTRFEDSTYWIFAEPEDKAEIVRRFPWKGHLVEAENEYSITRLDKDAELEKVGDYTVGKRQRVLVKECWIRDARLVFQPDYDANGEEIIDDQGDPVGQWLPKYPNGRLLVVANGVLLKDEPNPFWHGQPPYTLFPARIDGEIFSWSDVELLGRIEDKINRLHKDMIRNARVNMNSPWVVDRHAFDSPKKFNLLTQDPGLVLPVAQGARVVRLPPAELPQFIFPLISWLRGIFDDLLGVQAVMRGQLEKGSQLSADAVENLQVSSSSRLRFRARLMENSLKHLGHQLQWMIRQFYPSDLKVTVHDPRSGEEKQLAWSPDMTDPNTIGNYEIQIQTGSALPGSKEGGNALYLKLWNLDLIDRATTLKALRVPNADAIAKEVEKNEAKRALLGTMSRRSKTGSAGRKQGSF